MPLTLGRYDSPVGPLAIATDDDVLLAIDFNGDVKALAHRLSLPDTAADAFPDAARPVLDRLDAYFAGDLAALDRIAVRPAGTPFQRRVWDALRTIRAGTTSSYRDLAVRIGSPSAVRAVGAANGANPIPIVVPCHRVIGTNGALVGYGGGLDRKRWLLAHEGIIAARLWDRSLVAPNAADGAVGRPRSVDALLHDVRYALRSLGRARGFTTATVLALTLGVGATTALFAVLWAVLLRPLPYRSPDRLVTILHGDAVSAPVSPADYLDFRRRRIASPAWRRRSRGAPTSRRTGAPSASRRCR